MSNIVKYCEETVIVPSPKDLSYIHTNLSCPELNCQSVFKSTSNLKMHLAKHHKRNNVLERKEPEHSCFACPDEDCKYSIKSTKRFPKLKLLKQHYLKCHVDKSYTCLKCLKGFSTAAYLKAHSKSCGKKFICSCRWEYSTREALLTHCKRKAHSPADEESAKKECVTDEDDLKCKGTVEDKQLLQVCISSPPLSRSPRKPSTDIAVFPTHYVAAIALSELSTTFIIPKNCHIGVQTVETKQVRKCRGAEKMRQSSQETQTAHSVKHCKKQKISTETQTSVHVKQHERCKKIYRKRSTETQTKDPMLFLSSVNNESLDDGIFNESSLSNTSINDELPRKSLDEDTVWGSASHNKSPQTKPIVTTINSNIFDLGSEIKMESHSLNHVDKVCNNETQTEMDALFSPEPEGTSTTETQTTDDLIEDLYSHMCTQTCSDATNLFDFNFVDIETQTAWPDL